MNLSSITNHLCLKIIAPEQLFINITLSNYTFEGQDDNCSFGGVGIFNTLAGNSSELTYCSKHLAHDKAPGEDYPFSVVSSGQELTVVVYSYLPYAFVHITFTASTTPCMGFQMAMSDDCCKQQSKHFNPMVLKTELDKHETVTAQIKLYDLPCVTLLAHDFGVLHKRMFSINFPTRTDHTTEVKLLVFTGYYREKLYLSLSSLSLLKPDIFVVNTDGTVSTSSKTAERKPLRSKLVLPHKNKEQQIYLVKHLAKDFHLRGHGMRIPLTTFWFLLTVRKKACVLNLDSTPQKHILKELNMCTEDLHKLADINPPMFTTPREYVFSRIPEKIISIQFVGSCVEHCYIGSFFVFDDRLSTARIRKTREAWVKPFYSFCNRVMYFRTQFHAVLELYLPQGVSREECKTGNTSYINVNYGKKIQMHSEYSVSTPKLRAYRLPSLYMELPLGTLYKQMSWEAAHQNCSGMNASLVTFETIQHVLEMDNIYSWLPLAIRKQVRCQTLAVDS